MVHIEDIRTGSKVVLNKDVINDLGEKIVDYVNKTTYQKYRCTISIRKLKNNESENQISRVIIYDLSDEDTDGEDDSEDNDSVGNDCDEEEEEDEEDSDESEFKSTSSFEHDLEKESDKLTKKYRNKLERESSIYYEELGKEMSEHFLDG